MKTIVNWTNSVAIKTIVGNDTQQHTPISDEVSCNSLDIICPMVLCKI